ncbi:MAG: heme ABC exporter ATP-binding protein CcmA [Actinomycetota bacterium]|nr:heme ABC exporter ATP-binding protein CcmA [Actinomycetota bacterium]
MSPAPDPTTHPAGALAVEFTDAVAVVGGFPVLAGAHFEVRRGEIVLLHGPNGAGKTSLLRLCAGLLPLERGRATVLGLDLVRQCADVRRRVGLLGHSNGLYADLTVSENVTFWGATAGAVPGEIAAAMERMGLDGRLSGVVVGQCSAGQKRRTALACLVVRRAELWLLDEPHASLDATARDELDDLLRAAAAAGATVVVASHETERAATLATRQLAVAGGQVIDDTPAQGLSGGC